MESKIQIGDKVQFLKQKNPSRNDFGQRDGIEEMGTISDETEDSDIDDRQVIRIENRPQGSQDGRNSKIHDAKEKDGLF